MVKMNQKPSVDQTLKSVPQVLTSDSPELQMGKMLRSGGFYFHNIVQFVIGCVLHKSVDVDLLALLALRQQHHNAASRRHSAHAKNTADQKHFPGYCSKHHRSP